MGAGVAVGVASFETIDTERHEFSSGKAPGMKRHTSTRQATGRHQKACGCWNFTFQYTVVRMHFPRFFCKRRTTVGARVTVRGCHSFSVVIPHFNASSAL